MRALNTNMNTLKSCNCSRYIASSPTFHLPQRLTCRGAQLTQGSALRARHEVVSGKVHPTCQAHDGPVSQGPGTPAPLMQLLNGGARWTAAAHMAWSAVLQPGDTVVDATAGNGHDTLALAKLVGPSGAVYAMDIQEAALASTSSRLARELHACSSPTLHLLQDCHSKMVQHVGSKRAKVIAFNLGYLPNGDRAITTQTPSTLAAVQAALEVIMPGGLITILAYTGHPGGQEEYQELSSMVARLSPQQWTCVESRLSNRPTAPVLILIWSRWDVRAAA